MKKLQYTTNDPSSSTDYLAGDNTWKPMTGGGGGVPYTGATANVDLGEYGLSGGFIEFDTTPTSTPTTQGTMSWDVDHNTVQLVMNGHVGQVMQDQFYFAKNQTGSTIPKGTVVMAAGTLGASGRILITPFLADGTYPSEYMMGVTAEAIADGSDGMVMHFGQLRSIDTSSYSDGDLLYASTTSAGAFTTTPPTAPNNIVLVAIVIHAAANGVIQVRPTIGSNINKDEGVKITSPSNGQLLKYNSSTGLWENATVTQAPAKSFMNNLIALSVTSSTTTYTTMGSNSFNTTELNRVMVIPEACTFSRLYVRIITNQVAGLTSTLVFTIRKNSADTAITCTIAGGSAGGTIASDITNSVSFAAGDLMSVKIRNNAIANSASIGNISIMMEV